MRIAILDDSKPTLSAITAMVTRWCEQKGIDVRVESFQESAAMLDAVQRERFNVYLLDVLMPGVDGIAAAKEIRLFDDTAEIVFLTSTKAYAYESYGVHAADYLLKPVNEAMLFPVLDRLYLRGKQPEEALTLKSGPTLIRLPYEKIVFVEVNGKHLYFNLTDGSVREIYGSLNEYEPMLLSRPEFMRVHRSYIVNMLQAAELSARGVLTFTGRSIPVSRRMYQDIQKEYLALLFAGREGPDASF